MDLGWWKGELLKSVRTRSITLGRTLKIRNILSRATGVGHLVLLYIPVLINAG